MDLRTIKCAVVIVTHSLANIIKEKFFPPGPTEAVLFNGLELIYEAGAAS